MYVSLVWFLNFFCVLCFVGVIKHIAAKLKKIIQKLTKYSLKAKRNTIQASSKHIVYQAGVLYYSRGKYLLEFFLWSALCDLWLVPRVEPANKTQNVFFKTQNGIDCRVFLLNSN